MKPQDRLIIALDKADESDILVAANDLIGLTKTFKIGSTAYNANGPGIVKALGKMGARVFLDLKLFDIPEQVAGAAAVAGEMGVYMMTVHALGGPEMMAAAKESGRKAAEAAGKTPPIVVGVTILTSLDDTWLNQIGLPGTEITVPALARAAQAAGLDGVVCSAREAGSIKTACGTDFITVVPGIRLPDAAADDQKRVATPESAVRAGADYLVVGRPVTASADPAGAVAEILRRLA